MVATYVPRVVEKVSYDISKCLAIGAEDTSHSCYFCFSGRVFSAAGHVVNKKRVGLDPDNVHLLIFLGGNKNFVERGDDT
jgi:hypothetical protein